MSLSGSVITNGVMVPQEYRAPGEQMIKGGKGRQSSLWIWGSESELRKREFLGRVKPRSQVGQSIGKYCDARGSPKSVEVHLSCPFLCTLTDCGVCHLLGHQSSGKSHISSLSAFVPSSQADNSPPHPCISFVLANPIIILKRKQTHTKDSVTNAEA